MVIKVVESKGWIERLDYCQMVLMSCLEALLTHFLRNK